ncbi:centromere-associated protein E isoform X1 [Hydra vulgaris]|uniref:centromere-associated protein E isoform X1 n=1 Tax=Hydra vulgaris TaxID=6087 RepID=UPI001F5F0388|nr:centromere-associated protein E isoform X1 [Hydra vulgaris]
MANTERVVSRTRSRKLNKIFELDDEFEKISNDTSNHSDTRLLGSNGIRSKLLKDELYHMIMRERETLEEEYSTRVNNLLQSFKNKKSEWEEMVRLEREDLENQFERERSEMNAAFAHEIANLARISEEEKALMNKQFEEKMKLREQEFEKEKDNLKQFFLNESEKIKVQLLSECEEKVKNEQKRKNEKHINETINLEKKFESSKTEIEASYKRQIEMLETKHNKVCFELERKYAEEKITLEREFQRRLEISEMTLRKETLNREEIERIATLEKNNTQALVNMLKEEIERFKEEIDRLKKQPIPCPEVRIVEKEVPNNNSVLSFKSRMDLPPNLKDEFDFLLNEYKENLKDKYKSDNEAMEKKIEIEKGKLKEKFLKQKEELEKRLNEEKLRIEKDFNRNREDMEKEIERRLRTKQLQESLLDHQKRFDDSNRKIAEEDRFKLEKVLENENKRNAILIQELTQENEGLKLKAKALEDNNQLLKNLKEEGQQEVDRLRNVVQDLKIIVEEKKISDKNPASTDYSSLIMTLINQQQQKQVQQPSKTPDQNILKKEEEIKAEKKKLEKLRLDLQQQEKDIKDRKNIEDAAKLALDKSHEKYENLLSEKNRLEKSLKSLEGKVFSMQDEFAKMKNTPQQHSIPVKPMYHGILESSDTQFTFIPIQSPNQTVNSPNTPLPFLHPNQSVLTNKIENLKKKLKDSQYGYSVLEKEIRDRERQIEKLENALMKEKEISSGLRDSLSEEKSKFVRYKDEKEKEIKMLMKAKRSTEEIKLQLELEVQELKSKLQHAGQTLTAVRKQASDDLNSSYILQRDTNEVVRNLKSPGFSQTVASILANSEKRKVNIDPKYQSDSKFVYVNSSPEDIDRVKRLENDKKKLEVELESVKENLNNYTNKLENQLRKLEIKVEQQNDFIIKRPVSKLDDDVNQDSLRNQKVHLQKLIGRLSALQH